MATTRPFPTGATRYVIPCDNVGIVPAWFETTQIALLRARSGSPPAPLPSNDDYAPIACISSDQVMLLDCTKLRPENTKGCEVQQGYGGGLDRCLFMLGDLIPNKNDKAIPPPPIRFQIRAAIASPGQSGGNSEVVFEKQIIATGWQDNGEIVQVSGHLCTQWELWAYVDKTDHPDADQVGLGVILMGSTGSGGVFSVHQGVLVP